MMKQAIFCVVLLTLYDYVASDEVEGPYNMGVMITCFEQNDEDFAGYKDNIWSDPASSSCIDYPELAERYSKSGKYPGKGDVCDHYDPIEGTRRDSCYFNVIFGAEINEEKTWSFKCWEFDRCPVKDDDGNPKEGFQITNKRINYCCKSEDFCNGNDLVKVFAAYGNPEKYPPDFQELCDIDFASYGYWVKFNVAGYEQCSYDPDKDTQSSPEVAEVTYTEGQSVEVSYPAAHSGNLHNLYHNDPPAQIPQSDEIVNVADILLIFTYFVIGIACLAIGIFIGTKWQKSVNMQSVDNKLEV